jgi:hypothetical protein
MPASCSNAKQPLWGCKCGFENWATRPVCNKCQNGAPYKVLAKIAEDKAGRWSGADSGSWAKPWARAGSPSAGAAGSGGSADGKLQKLFDQAKRTHASELKKLKDEMVAIRKAQGDMDQSSHEGVAGPAADDDGSLSKAVTLARERLTKVKAMPEELRDLVAGGYELCLARLQGELNAAQAARRAVTPLSKQLEGAEAHKLRMAKKLAEARSDLLAREAELRELNEGIALQQAAVSEAEAAAAKACAEVATLAAKYAEGSAESAEPRAPPELMETPPGFVSIAFAEEKWAEREVVMAQHMAQLQALVEAAQAEGGSAGADAEPSMALDDILDEGKWSKVAPSKRRALLHRERDAFAGKVRASLGSIGKASGIDSPFAKKGAAAARSVA